ncbi:MAG: hypothetical protein K9N01_00370 [Cephaloticoccus sp.]|nr:hypothetical protein [Cephaloticoccus sp.]
MRDYRNHALIFLGLTTLATGYLAWHEARELSELRKAQASSGVAETRRKAWESRRSSEAQDMEDAAIIAEAEKSSEPAEEAPVNDFRPGRGQERAIMKLMENPEFLRLMTLQQKARLDPRYAALFRQLGLTPDMLDKFKDLLVEKQSALIDLFTAARSQGLDPRKDREAFRELATSAQNQIDESIRATLGDTAFATYQNYEKTLPYRNVTDQLETRLSYTPNPLTLQQKEQLLQVIATSAEPAGPNRQAATARAAGAGLGGNVGGGQVATLSETAVQRAAGILTPGQQSVLKQMQAEQTAAQQLRELTRGGVRPATATPPTAGSNPAN